MILCTSSANAGRIDKNMAIGVHESNIPGMFFVKRSYDPPAPADGYRVLVDRLWPRGLPRDRAAFDEWMQEIAPSAELRRWFQHRPEKWPEFERRYWRELRAPERQNHVTRLEALAEDGPVTLLYSARNTAHNNAVALRRFLTKRRR